MDITLVYLVAFGLWLLLIGYFLPFLKNKTTARIIVWSLGIITVFVSAGITAEESALYRMIAIVSLQLLSMKAVVIVETYSGNMGLTFIQWCAFSLGWFGMRPVLFEKLPSPPLPYISFVITGISRMAIGIVLLYISVYIERNFISLYYASALALLVGLSMILHFGILNLSAASWRLSGVDVKELFRSPYKASSLKEFWGKRWNIAFSEMTSLIIYRPLKNSIGPTPAMLAAFFLSGILHEIAISFPVNAGFGLPLLYFVIHGIVMYAEGEIPFVKKIIGHRILSHVWVMLWLILPMPLLFHVQFIKYVLVPCRDAILSLLPSLGV
jgi:alginate O-acetyltransferase complex protein AlgI